MQTVIHLWYILLLLDGVLVSRSSPICVMCPVAPCHLRNDWRDHPVPFPSWETVGEEEKAGVLAEVSHILFP